MNDILQMMANQGRKQIHFGETTLGHRYLNNTIPELVFAIKKLATAVNQDNALSPKEIKAIQDNLKRLALVAIQNDDFYRTRMGMNYYQYQIPEMVSTLKTIIKEKESEAEIKEKALLEKKEEMISQKKAILEKMAATDDKELISFYAGQIEFIETYFG